MIMKAFESTMDAGKSDWSWVIQTQWLFKGTDLNVCSYESWLKQIYKKHIKIKAKAHQSDCITNYFCCCCRQVFPGQWTQEGEDEKSKYSRHPCQGWPRLECTGQWSHMTVSGRRDCFNALPKTLVCKGRPSHRSLVGSYVLMILSEDVCNLFTLTYLFYIHYLFLV